MATPISDEPIFLTDFSKNALHFARSKFVERSDFLRQRSDRPSGQRRQNIGLKRGPQNAKGEGQFVVRPEVLIAEKVKIYANTIALSYAMDTVHLEE